ncbi:hypothetical protein ACFYZJ_30585 [Streptomyces sp. NPDC001848]|uniref:hypothetical protein n=1 Tax=Streptomyces sp. NPDC001848 TaxID=3364618 RepID=UPI0036740E2A
MLLGARGQRANARCPRPAWNRRSVPLLEERFVLPNEPLSCIDDILGRRKIDGDAEEAVAILASVFDRATGNQLWYRWTVVRAIRATALLGAAARPLVPRLEQPLADPETVPAAALALLAITDPDVVDLGRLVEAALHSGETGANIAGACEAPQALGATALSTHQRLRVAELADRDRRIVGAGVANSIIREDERLRAILTAI